jgi:hypothetical protein
MDSDDRSDVTAPTSGTESTTVGSEGITDREQTPASGGLARLRERFGSRGDGMSRVDAERAVERSRRVGGLMDEAFTVPGLGYRVGLDPLVGIAPVAGDAVRIGAPVRTLVTMVLLIGIDFLVGSIPVLGTVLDAVLKVNKWNASMLESHVESSFN